MPRNKRGTVRKRKKEKAKIGSPNIVLLIFFIGILLFGVLMVFDASYFLKGWDRILKQIQWIGLGFVVFIPLLLIDYKALKYMAIPAIIVTVLALPGI